MKKLNILKGIVAIWKPKGPTSHDVVAIVKKLTGERKVGHAGTLDPLAEGVLIVAIGRENTKKIDKVKEQEKEYIAQIRFGQTSTTDDAEGEKKIIKIKKIPTKNEIADALNEFRGEILQKAPRFSAVKIRGKEAYKRARKGEDFPLPPRSVEIKELEILDYSWPGLKLRVATGPGVYIRSLARDLGSLLGVGAFLAGLTRTRVGDFNKKNSISFSGLDIEINKNS